MGDSDWFFPIVKLRGMFETAYQGTVFGGSVGTVAPLAAKLGGDRNWWPALQASIAVNNAAFFELVHAKAHFLLLPEQIATDLKEASIVDISEDVPSSGAAASTTIEEDRVLMRIPGVIAGLVQAGYGLGRSTSPFVGASTILVNLYHEMTHAWLELQELGARPRDADLQQILLAYESALQGTGIDPGRALTEAAAYYVQDQISRWCLALNEMDALIRNKPQDHEELQTELQRIVSSYESTFHTGPGATIGSPQVWAAFRDALDKKVLDGCPCTKPFDDTPLAGLRTTLLTP